MFLSFCLHEQKIVLNDFSLTMQTWHEQNMYLHAHDDENDDDESLFLIAP